jgi:Bacterial Ig-like domain (group 3)/FG-GAP-like repeat
MQPSNAGLRKFIFVHSIKTYFAVIALMACLCAFPQMVRGISSGTTTTLSVSPTSVSAGTAATLTATVMLGTDHITRGIVVFCDANAEHCEGSAIFGKAQLTSSGVATLRLILGVNTYSIDAVFLGTGANPTSKSVAHGLTVNGIASYGSATTITAGGSPGNYILTGTVAAFGRPVPIGSVSFLDISNQNFVVGTAALDPITLGFNLTPGPGPSAVGAFPYCAAAGDFNNDGKMDLAVSNGNNTVSVLLGNEDGTFQPQMTYNTDPNGTPYAIAVGDFNEDGNTDLVVTNSVGGSSDTVSILLGNGEGTFQPQQTYSVGFGAQGVAVGDFNYDGSADLAVTNDRDNTVSVLLGNGDGTFQSQVTYAVGNQPSSISTADFNGDGQTDLVMSNLGDNSVSVLLGNGDGTFQPQVAYAVGNYPVGVAVGDFNGDGNADLAVANGNDSTVSVLLGNSDGTFQSQVAYATGTFPFGTVVDDFDGDGKADLATPNFIANTVSVLLGNGDGTFQSQVSYAVGTLPVGIAVGDFSGDGLADVTTASHTGPGTISVLLSERTESATATGVSVYGLGTHNVLASYPGDTSHAASHSTTIPLTGVEQTTTTGLTASPNPGIVGQPVTFTATVSPAPTGMPTGTVSFYTATVLLGTGTVNNVGVATFTTTSLAPGSYGITAVYSGNAGFETSTSTVLGFKVGSAPTYTVTAPTTPFNVTRGGSVNLNVSLLPVGGAYNSLVTMSASGLPAGATATFNPPTVTPGGVGSPTVMTIQTSVQTASIPRKSNQQFPFTPVSLAAGICLFAGKRKRLAKSLSVLMVLAILAGGTLMMTGCSGLAEKRTQAQSHVITIVGTSGALHASTTVTLIVQ